jgi:transposase
MKEVIKQCVGIDISKASFTACVCERLLSGELLTSPVEDFENNKHGFNQFIKWHRKLTNPHVEILFLMEATGIYYESIAYFLHRLNLSVSVILPNKVKHYAKSLNIKTKTDIVDARIIARMGAERELTIWQPPAPILKQLRDLTRLYTDLKQERTVYLNRLESGNASEETLRFVINSNRAILKKLEEQIKQCEMEIEKLLFAEEWLSKKIVNLMTIKGVGLITLAIIIAETQGFAMVNSRKQLASYAGYDVVKRESGTSIKGKTRISKKGNSRIRAALYFPSMVASRHNPDLKEDYQRINIGKPSKMVGMTALQRKILLLIYSLWKNDAVYRQNENQTSGNRKTKILLRQRKTVEKKVGNSIKLPTQDELPYNLSTEVLLRQLQSS